MTLFGPVMGNLPLLELPAAKLQKLSGQDYYDFMTQLRHHCIRSAWMKSTHSNHDIRPVLDLTVGRAALTLCRVRAVAPSTRFLDMDMEHARRENEWWSCFGVFLEEEVMHLMHEDGPGPVLTSIIAPEAQTLGMFRYAALLRRMLIRYRQKLQDDSLALDTALFVQAVSKRHACIDSLPGTVEGYFGLAELADEIIDATVSELDTPH